MKFRKLTAAAITIVMLFSSQSIFAAPQENTQEYSGEFEVFRSIADFVANNYIDDSYTIDDIMKKGLSELLENDEQLLIELLKATLESMDDYSEFYTPEEFKKFQEQLNKTFYGIGVSVKQMESGYIEIVGFPSGSDNAQKAGFEVGDKIVKVDGNDVTGLDLQSVRDRLVGEEGTTVAVTVLRDGKEIELTAQRIATNDRTVAGAVLKGDIGYIQILTFGLKTDEEFAEQLDVMREKGVKKIILDLRNNGGGVVNAAIGIAELIVPKGKIIDVKYRQPEYNATYNSQLEKKEFDFAVLVNSHTASSAEILASAIQDSGAGKLVGETTFGKAVIQNTYTTISSAIKLTTGKYITRNGKEINKVGLTPDIEVKDTISGVDMNEFTAFDYTTRTSCGFRSNNVKSAKEKLKLLGIYEGNTENDMLDTGFRNVLKEFQRQNDILAYGVLDVVTQETIDDIISKVEITDNKQFETAYELLGGNVDNLE